MAMREELRAQGDWLFRNRSYLPIGIVLIGFAVYVVGFRENLPESAGWSSSAYAIGCIIVGLVGVAIRAFTLGYVAPNTSGRNTVHGQVASTVNTKGIYSVVRHPLYLGNFFMWLGVAGFTHEPWFIVAFVLFYALYYERIMYAEEAFLIETYGSAYTDWAAHTPAIIPALGQYEPSNRQFSWRKVIKQEKTGIFNLFLLAFLFHALGAWVAGYSIWTVAPWWTLLLVLALLYLIVVKLIQKNTGYFRVAGGL